jgi:hypothetical protein
MAVRGLKLAVFVALLLSAQEPQPATIPEEPAEPPVEWVCPMDADQRSKSPGKCPRCGMKLEAGIPDLAEYRLRIRNSPRVLRPGRQTNFTFEVLHPDTGKRVDRFNLIHEKLFHLFFVSEDLSYFAHEHPEPGPGGVFRYSTTLPLAGPYRLLCDFYPEGGTPQLITKTLIAPGKQSPRVPLKADLGAQRGENMQVQLVTEPPQPLARMKTLMFFRLTPHEGLEPYLGAWGHMLAASEDLIDVVHQHPAFPEAGEQVQFNLLFPRPGIYRVWVQFQRQGKINTVAFNVPVKEL